MERTNLFLDGEVTGYNPDMNGDLRTIDDLIMDANYNHAKVCEALLKLSSTPTADYMIIYGGLISQGTPSGKVNISAAVAIGKGTIHTTYPKLIVIPAISNVTLPAGWNDDREIWVILKHKWKLGSSTRNHHTTAESYHYTVMDSYDGESDTTVEDALFTDADPTGTCVVLGSFKMNGTTFGSVDYTERTAYCQFSLDTMKVDHIEERTSLHGIDFGSIKKIGETYEIFTQAQFNSLFHRESANVYNINDNIKSIRLHYLSGGYQVYPIISGGDTWGDSI